MIELLPVQGVPEVLAGDDLAQEILDALSGSAIELLDGDVVVVTQKVVSKAEGRVVPEQPLGKAEWVRRESRRVVARRGDLVIVETPHGFVCANAGVDASNVGEGLLSLLPEDPDASAARLRARFEEASGRRLAVVVTDTFGRAWRHGLVNVAIGCAGLPSLIDLRGKPDATGRELEVTIEAFADEVAAASGLVMGKADGVPVAIVRGVDIEGPDLPAHALVRRGVEDLFRESPAEALRQVGPEPVPPGTADGEASLAVLRAIADEPPGWPSGRHDAIRGATVFGEHPLRTELRGRGFRSSEAPVLFALGAGPRAQDEGWDLILLFGLRLRSSGFVFDWIGAEGLRALATLFVGGEVPLGVFAVGPLPVDG